MSNDRPDTSTQTPAWSLYDSVIWPAVAGNILWSFLTVMITEAPSHEMGWRAASLFLAGVYLMIAWARGRSRNRKNPNFGYYLADTAYAVLLAGFAIASSASASRYPDLGVTLLGVMFVVAALGHFFKTWNPNRKAWQRNTIGVADVAAAGAVFLFRQDPVPAIAILVVALLILIVGSVWNEDENFSKKKTETTTEPPEKAVTAGGSEAATH